MEKFLLWYIIVTIFIGFNVIILLFCLSFVSVKRCNAFWCRRLAHHVIAKLFFTSCEYLLWIRYYYWVYFKIFLLCNRILSKKINWLQNHFNKTGHSWLKILKSNKYFYLLLLVYCLNSVNNLRVTIVQFWFF